MTDKPTELTSKDFEAVFKYLQDFEIKSKTCWTCGKKHFNVYGESTCECDECYFARFPKEQVKAFYRSFFE